MQIINLADMKDPNDESGRSYREVNNAKQHQFAEGQLVEIENGVRMLVAKQARDCDGTPLYNLAACTEDIEMMKEHGISFGISNGHGEENMKSV